MRWLWSFSRVYATVGVVFCVVLFAAMIISGQGLKSFIVLAAAAYWAVMARYDAQRVASPSRASQTSSRAHARRNLARAAPRRLTSGTRTAAITGMVLVGPRPCLSSRSPESQARELASPRSVAPPSALLEEGRRTTERRAVAGRWPASPRKLAVTVRRRLAPPGGTMDAVQRPARMGTTTRRTPRPRRTVSVIVPTVERATRPLTTSAQRAPRRQRRGVALEIRSAPTAR